MKKYITYSTGHLQIQGLPRMGLSILFCMFLLFSTQGFAQTRNVTEVIMNPSMSSGIEYPVKPVVEEKALEFFIVGIADENDVWVMEELLMSQPGIDRARISADQAFCLVITLKGSKIDETFITSLVKSKGFSIEKYSERWIHKRVTYVGEEVKMYDPSPQSREGKNSLQPVLNADENAEKKRLERKKSKKLNNNRN